MEMGILQDLPESHFKTETELLENHWTMCVGFGGEIMIYRKSNFYNNQCTFLFLLHEYFH